METKQTTRVKSGLFNDPTQAESAYQDTLKRGYKPDEINVLMSEETKKKYAENYSTLAKIETGDKSMEGLALGGALGGTLVGTLAALVALSTPITLLGLVIVGPLAAGLVGAGTGSIAGGLLGALIGSGIPEEHAKIYENGIKKGGTVLVVNSRNPKDDALLIADWKEKEGKDIF